MTTMSVKEFKTNFKKVIDEKKSVVVTRRKKPIGIFQPYEKTKIGAKRQEIARRMINAGESKHKDTSENHDEVLYS
jgi:hypothetical protein